MHGIITPELRTPRLILRAPRAEDHGALLALARDPQVARFLHEGPPPSADELWNRLNGARAQWARLGYGMMVVSDETGFVGRTGIHHPASDADPFLFYALTTRSWGKGYASEAARCVLDWMITTHRPVRLISVIDPLHVSSARVASKLGAVRTGTTDWAGSELDVWSYPTAVAR